MTPSEPIILNEHRDLDTSFLRKISNYFCQQLILNSRLASYRSAFRTQLQTDRYYVLSTKTKLGDKEEKSLMRTSQRKESDSFSLFVVVIVVSFFCQGTVSAIKGSLKNKHEIISSIRPPQMAAMLETSACVGSQVSDACTVQPL